MANSLEGQHTVTSIREGNTNSFNTIFNSLNAISGVGLLSIPYALARGGWASLPLLFVVALASSFSSTIVKKCLEESPNLKSYADIGGHAFGPTGRVIISILLYLELYMITTGFLILEGENLHHVLREIHIHGIVSIHTKTEFIVMVGVVLAPFVWLDDLNILAYASATSVLCFVLVQGSIIYLGVFDGIGFRRRGDILNLGGIPTTLSIFMFCYGAHPVFPTLYSSMKEKRHFSEVIVLCFFLCTCSYAIMAILGYLMFGPATNSQVTLNLPTKQKSSKVAIWTVVLIPLSKYPLMMKPVTMNTEGLICSRYRKHRAIKVLIRTGLVASQVIFALGVPYFGHLISLVGALLSANASLLIPCICYWKMRGIRRGAEMVFIVSIIILGLLIVTLGTYTSLVEIVGVIKDSK